MADPINNPQLSQVCDSLVRPAADKLAGMCQYADQFAAVLLSPQGFAELLAPAGITPQLVMAPGMPTEQDFPDAEIASLQSGDTRRTLTRRKLLALIRIVAQFKGLKDYEQYDTPQWVQSIAFAIAVNPRV